MRRRSPPRCLFAVIGNNGFWNDSNPHLLLERLVLLTIFAVLALILIRLGMVSTVAALFFINTIDRINLGPGLRSWYTPMGWRRWLCWSRSWFTRFGGRLDRARWEMRSACRRFGLIEQES